MSGIYSSRRKPSEMQCSDDAYLALSHGSVLGRVDGFAEHKWNVGASKERYSLIFAARMTLPHFSFSAAMNVPNSTGEVAKAVSPQSAIVNKISGCDIDLEPCRLRSGRMPWAGLGRRKTDDGKNPNRLAADRADPPAAAGPARLPPAGVRGRGRAGGGVARAVRHEGVAGAGRPADARGTR